MSLPRVPKAELLSGFNGNAHFFDALSFWLTVYGRERERTFALVMETHHTKTLDEPQREAYRIRLMADTKLVQDRFRLKIYELYAFLSRLIEIHDDYRKEEHYKLADALENDIYHLAQLIGLLTSASWDEIADELGNRFTTRISCGFRDLNIAGKERHESQGRLT